MKKLLLLFLLMLSKNILSINKELKQAIEERNFAKTELLLQQTYKTLEATDKAELNNAIKEIKSTIFTRFNISTIVISGIFSFFGIRVLYKFSNKFCDNSPGKKSVNFSPSFSVGYSEIEDFINTGLSWKSISPPGGCETNTVNIPMLGFSALFIYIAEKQITKTIKSLRICNLLEKYTNSSKTNT